MNRLDLIASRLRAARDGQEPKYWAYEAAPDMQYLLDIIERAKRMAEGVARGHTITEVVAFDYNGSCTTTQERKLATPETEAAADFLRSLETEGSDG